MSQIIRPTRSPDVPVHGKMRNVERSGLRYMSDSSMRTNPSIDDPSNMILPSSASSNCRSGISTFLIVPRMSVNCRRMNLTFSRSVRSRICAFVSFGAVVVGLAMAPNSSSPWLSELCGRVWTDYSSAAFVSNRKGVFMRLVKLFSVVVALAGLTIAVLVAAPSVYGHSSDGFGIGVGAGAGGSQQRDSDEAHRWRELRILSGRGVEIGASVRDVAQTDKERAGVVV